MSPGRRASPGGGAPPETGEPGSGWSVTVIDNFHRTDPEARIVVEGFRSRAEAREYALRRVRSSIEQCRREATDDEDLRSRWNALGEEALVDGEYIGLAHFGSLAAAPAGPEDCDWLALDPGRRKPREPGGGG